MSPGSLSIISGEQRVCVCVCVCVYNCVSICQGLTLSSHIHFIQYAKLRGPLKIATSFTFIKTMPFS